MLFRSKIATCGDVAAIGSYNGREIYVQNTDKQLGTITTTMPIRNITVSETGRVTTVLADTDVAWIMTYEADGTNSYTGQAHMTDGGYPVSVSLSPDGELLAISYLYVDAGVVKSNVTFYNFGPVGENQSDYMVSAYSYSDLVVPKVQFMNNDTAFAVGDSRLMIMTCGVVGIVNVAAGAGAGAAGVAGTVGLPAFAFSALRFATSALNSTLAFPERYASY